MTEVCPRALAPFLTACLLPISIWAQAAVVPHRVWSVGPLVPVRTVNEVAFGPNGASVSRHVDTQTMSTFSATRSIAFAGDRVVLVVRTGTRNAAGVHAPLSSYLLLSMDASTGEVKERRELDAFASLPIFATGDGHVIAAARRLYRMDPDLNEAGVFDYEKDGHSFGNVQNASPDGSTLGNGTSPGFELIDSRTLVARQLTKAPSVATSVNSQGFVTDNRWWIGQYPNDQGFVTYTDDHGERLLYHGPCPGRPEFITDDLILQPACHDAVVINLEGQPVLKLRMGAAFSYAGASQDGKRFALQLASFDRQGQLRKERFAILSTLDGRRIAEIAPDEQAEVQSWSAFSPDGRLFAVGSPLRLSLWRLPD